MSLGFSDDEIFSASDNGSDALFHTVPRKTTGYDVHSTFVRMMRYSVQATKMRSQSLSCVCECVCVCACVVFIGCNSL
jgi:hypothetical protein